MIQRQKRTAGRWRLAIVAATTLLSVLTLAGCKDKEEKPHQELVPVSVASVTQRDFPIEVHANGNVAPFTSVAVRALVAGQLTQVSFKEGDDVQKGALLFTIDPRPFQAALAQAQANLRRDEAQLRNAETNASRYADLVKKDFVTREQYDKFVSDAEVARAVVAADRAAMQSAQLNLSYCAIRAPMNGRTGNLMAHPGDLVKANDTTPLVTINQVTPVYVQFSIPENILNQVRGHENPDSIMVTARAQAGGALLGEGRLSFIDNAIDPTTGTIALKATFPNVGRNLWPGQYVDVSMQVANRAGAIIVPVQAVQTGQNGQFVYVVKSSSDVEMRPVTVFKTVENEAIIDQGLHPGETVVTDGQLRLTPKSRIQIKSRA